MPSLSLGCGWCDWRDDYDFASTDPNPERAAREIIEAHVAGNHGADALRFFRQHVNRHGLSDPSNWDRATKAEARDAWPGWTP